MRKSDLSAPIRRWRDDVVKQFRMRSAGELATLDEAAHCLQRIEECRIAIRRDGMFVAGVNGVVAHPAERAERAHRALFLQACRQLGISDPTNIDGGG